MRDSTATRACLDAPASRAPPGTGAGSATMTPCPAAGAASASAAMVIVSLCFIITLLLTSASSCACPHSSALAGRLFMCWPTSRARGRAHGGSFARSRAATSRRARPQAHARSIDFLQLLAPSSCLHQPYRSRLPILSDEQVGLDRCPLRVGQNLDPVGRQRRQRDLHPDDLPALEVGKPRRSRKRHEARGPHDRRRRDRPWRAARGRWLPARPADVALTAVAVRATPGAGAGSGF